MSTASNDGPRLSIAAVGQGCLRVMTALLFLQHGLQKLFGYPVISERGIAEPFSFMGFAGMLELVGGLLMLVGLFTRPTAFVLCGQMAVAYFMAHAPRSFFPIVNEGELAIMFCFAFLFFAAAGPGIPSLDEWQRRRAAKRPQ